MDKSAKLYALAMKKYQNGYIDKALEYCEKGISISLKNAPAINLKGLLLYLKGDLENSRSMWKMNAEVNNDAVSKKYIESAKSDEERRVLYNKSLKYIKEIKIKEAMELLRRCEESDFNTINVGNAICSCLIRQGKYEEAEAYVEKVLSIDRNNKIAIENKEMLIEYGLIKKETSIKKIAVILSSAVLLLIVVYSSFNSGGIFGNKNSERKVSPDERHLEEVATKTEDAKIQNQNNKDETTDLKEQIATFPYDILSTAMNEGKYDEVYRYYSDWKDKANSANEKAIISKAEELLSQEGTKFFYTSGNQYFRDKEYGKALEAFKKGYQVGRNNHLYPDVVFKLGATYEKLGDNENSIRIYEEYCNNYKGGDYIEEVLYKLALMYESIDSDKAQKYAKKLENNYPDSNYINSKLKQILGER